ncbi:uncharacterized protein PADG_12113 [Paracoccidioides brasiliensis Pb18]|uniref:Uncharacterized protein n=1 Tax=Paracoccidioides brasiliensis (strain Pb18) TaxID=502780 RepID=A0A0A0HU27_PARBD|nr:uncharacterized protein PADG_12113 [Paracoccidioides brasiliensis Pb18]KGM91798.1 hypothetical protein PADG_12113 [Paracoccidioides brasiliensis Pb18]
MDNVFLKNLLLFELGTQPLAGQASYRPMIINAVVPSLPTNHPIVPPSYQKLKTSPYRQCGKNISNTSDHLTLQPPTSIKTSNVNNHMVREPFPSVRDSSKWISSDFTGDGVASLNSSFVVPGCTLRTALGIVCWQTALL